jgi:hypothetical protein
MKMKKFAFLALALCAFQVPTPQKLKVEMPVEYWNVVIQGLQELPAKIANPVTDEILRQVQAQVKPPKGDSGVAAQKSKLDSALQAKPKGKRP